MKAICMGCGNELTASEVLTAEELVGSVGKVLCTKCGKGKFVKVVSRSQERRVRGMVGLREVLCD